MSYPHMDISMDIISTAILLSNDMKIIDLGTI